MPWPTVAVNTTNMDANADSPLSARSDILDLTTKFNDLIAMRGVANGVASLDGSAKVPVAQMPAFRGALATASVAQALSSNNAFNTLAFDTEQYDTSGIHDTATNPSRLTVPAVVSKVRLRGAVSVDVPDGFHIQLSIWKNNAPLSVPVLTATYKSTTIATETYQISSPVLNVSPGDYFSLLVQYTDTVARNTYAPSCYFAMEIIE